MGCKGHQLSGITIDWLRTDFGIQQSNSTVLEEHLTALSLIANLAGCGLMFHKSVDEGDSESVVMKSRLSIVRSGR